MAAPLLLLCCIFTLSTSLSAVVFQSPEVITASVGDSVELNCTRDMPMYYCYSTMSWYKVNLRTGKVTEISSHNANLNQDKKTCTKTILNAQVQDSGLYYCTALHIKMLFIGNGTRVIVKASGPLKPSVVLYTPVELEKVNEEGEMEVEVMEDARSVLVQCVVMNVVPSQIRVLWIVDEDERAGWTESGWTGHSDSASEFTRAQLRIPVEEWREAAHVVQCVVMYGNETVSQTLRRQTHSGLCAWLLYGGCGVTVFAIAVAIIVTLCLRKEKRSVPVERFGSGIDDRRKQRAHGKQDTLRKRTTENEVEYSCLNHQIFPRQMNPPPPPPPPRLELS